MVISSLTLNTQLTFIWASSNLFFSPLIDSSRNLFFLFILWMEEDCFDFCLLFLLILSGRLDAHCFWLLIDSPLASFLIFCFRRDPKFFLSGFKLSSMFFFCLDRTLPDERSLDRCFRMFLNLERMALSPCSLGLDSKSINWLSRINLLSSRSPTF